MLKNTSVWDIFRKHAEYVAVQMSRLLKFRDLPTQSAQGPPLPCGCNLVTHVFMLENGMSWYFQVKAFVKSTVTPLDFENQVLRGNRAVLLGALVFFLFSSILKLMVKKLLKRNNHFYFSPTGFLCK